MKRFIVKLWRMYVKGFETLYGDCIKAGISPWI